VPAAKLPVAEDSKIVIEFFHGFWQ